MPPGDGSLPPDGMLDPTSRAPFESAPRQVVLAQTTLAYAACSTVPLLPVPIAIRRGRAASASGRFRFSIPLS